MLRLPERKIESQTPARDSPFWPHLFFLIIVKGGGLSPTSTTALPSCHIKYHEGEGVNSKNPDVRSIHEPDRTLPSEEDGASPSH